MAGLALNVLGKMPCMVEINEIRQIVDLHPFKRFAVFIKLAQFLDVWLVCGHDGMAVHADIHAGNTRMAGLIRLRMAVLTGNFILGGMPQMVERDRLFGGVPL